MAKQPTPAAEVIDVPMNEVLVTEDFSAANQLALATAQQDSAVRAVALQMGYALPADCTDPDLIQRDISANMRRSVEACLEVGKGLRVLKEACAHGSFMARLDVLGIDVGVASRFMQSAAKFSKLPTSATLKAINNQSKLFEMLVLDDDQLEELELTGQTGELALDDVATMSVKELRKAVREAKAEKEATEKLLENKNKQIDKLSRHIAKATPDTVLLELQKETTAFTNDALGCVQGQLRQAFIALKNHSDADHSLFMAGLLGQVQAELAALRDEFHLPDISNARDQELAAEVAQWNFPTPESTGL
ncbi:hypothetical protein [Rhodoferax sp.]|uniref:hypothetical protein n=1 Tax=Rhodoferax sp. TaxID=50421 RepID=UPI0025D24D8D|nr:hypothetical protein [Rhodoferax sp.]MCM2340442.1 hypothetical protein [Rhodoferax sp.]